MTGNKTTTKLFQSPYPLLSSFDIIQDIFSDLMHSTLYAIWGHSLSSALKPIRILLVGVGGIGCQILKILSSLPIQHVDILDMDTIETSNLNRQLLFKQQHNGQSKAQVAAQAMMELAPQLKITSHESNIYEMKLSFFRQFEVVIMALDNIEARTYVNDLSIRLGLVILDAGTAAYAGQAKIIQPSITSCYSCEPKVNSKKTYPSCTIRNRPKQAIHCVVWAKHLFEAFFYAQEEELLGDLSKLVHGEFSLQLAQQVFNTIFHDQVITHNNKQVLINSGISPLKFINPSFSETVSLEESLQEVFMNRTHSQLQYTRLFTQSLQQLMLARKDGPLPFEKDDDVMLSFIVASACLRMCVFKIQLVNHFKIKEMVGNIIPAIASTNAIVSALQISELLKMLSRRLPAAELKTRPAPSRHLFVQNTTVKKIIGNRADRPNPFCRVCAKERQPVHIRIDLWTSRLGQLLSIIEKESELQQYSVIQGASMIFAVDQYMDEEEREENVRKKEMLLEEFIKGSFALLLVYDDSAEREAFYILLEHEKGGEMVIKNVEGFRLRPMRGQKKMQGEEKKGMLLENEPRCKKSELIEEEERGVIKVIDDD